MSTRVSQFLAYVLRHAPESVDIELDRQGFADVEAVVATLAARYPGFDRAALDALVAADAKNRYTLRDGRIRANQGHSVSGVDAVDPTPREPPPVLFHGTSESAWRSIRASGGLKRMGRHHVHLSPDEKTARHVRARRRGSAVVLRIDAGRMHRDGLEFLLSDNGVWLTSAVPLQYVSLQSTRR